MMEKEPTLPTRNFAHARSASSKGGVMKPVLGMLCVCGMLLIGFSACKRSDTESKPQETTQKETAVKSEPTDEADQLEADKPAAIPAPSDVAAIPEDAERTDSGIGSKVLEKGSGGKHPTATSRVKVHYSGWTTDGKMFDSSVMRGQPAVFPLDRVIPGWTEGVQLMVTGEKRRFWIPEELAYKGRPGAPAGMLVFDVELIEILE